MITAKQANILALENDYNFINLMQDIKQSAKNGSYHYYYQDGNHNNNLDRYIVGLKELGFKVEKQNDSIQISW